jgi:hypothetical protein
MTSNRAPRYGAEELPSETAGVRGKRRRGDLTYLDPKGKWDQSMSEKRGMAEGVYATALRRLRDMVKATLLELQHPEAERHARRHHTWGKAEAEPRTDAATTPDPGCFRGHASRGGRRTASVFKGANGGPKSRYHVPPRRNAGSPKGREPYGDGAAIVVRGRESRPHGEGRQVPTPTGAARYA